MNDDSRHSGQRPFQKNAVLTGLLLLLFGLAVFAGIWHFAVGAKKPGAPPGDLTGQVTAVVGMMICLALFRGFLYWNDLMRAMNRRKNDVEDFGRSGQAASGLGRFIAQCGPRHAGQFHYIVFGLAMLVLAVVCLVAPWTFLQPKPGDEKMITTASIIAAAVCGLCGLGMLWSPLFGRNQVISLYEGGLLEQVGSSARAIEYDHIQHLRLQEWYEHRFAPRTVNVKANVLGQKDLSFSSALRGDSETIIAYLAEQVRSVETVPFTY